MTNADQLAYEELCCYTLSRGDPSFIHQHAVDAFGAQSFTFGQKPIRLVFALIGLHLHLDHQFTGRQVQLAHTKLGRHEGEWPVLPLPADRGAITAEAVGMAAAGPERDSIIERWCASVWAAFRDNHPVVIALTREHHLVP